MSPLFIWILSISFQALHHYTTCDHIITYLQHILCQPNSVIILGDSCTLYAAFQGNTHAWSNLHYYAKYLYVSYLPCSLNVKYLFVLASFKSQLSPSFFPQNLVSTSFSLHLRSIAFHVPKFRTCR